MRVVDGCSELVRLAARLIIEEAPEGERRDAVGPRLYAALARAAGHSRGIHTTEFEPRQVEPIRDEVDRDSTACNTSTAGATPAAAPT